MCTLVSDLLKVRVLLACALFAESLDEKSLARLIKRPISRIDLLFNGTISRQDAVRERFSLSLVRKIEDIKCGESAVISNDKLD